MVHRDHDPIVFFARELALEEPALIAPFEGGDDHVVVRATCPGCFADVERKYRRGLPTGAKRWGQLNEPLVNEPTITVTCRCGYPHANTPAGDAGCGAYWKVEWE